MAITMPPPHRDDPAGHSGSGAPRCHWNPVRGGDLHDGTALGGGLREDHGIRQMRLAHAVIAAAVEILGPGGEVFCTDDPGYLQHYLRSYCSHMVFDLGYRCRGYSYVSSQPYLTIETAANFRGRGKTKILQGTVMGVNDKLCIALLAGGKSGEREVSLSGAAIFEEALDPQKFTIRKYDPAYDLAKLAAECAEIDFAFILLHGLFGEDGSVQGMLDLLDIPYQGSGILGSAVAMDKNLAKMLYQLEGMPVADWEIVSETDMDSCRHLVERMGLPLVIKPVRDGSSLGLTIARTLEQVHEGIEHALKNDHRVMVEQYIDGREITVSVLGNDNPEAMPVIEIVPGDEYEFFDYNAKYLPGASKEICPAEIDDEQTRLAQEYGVKAHKILQLKGYSRTDMIIAGDGTMYLLETNTIPGMTRTSLLPQSAAAHGLEYAELLERLIELGIEAKGK